MPTRVKVKQHTRNGKPVRGYTRKQTPGEHIASILRGDSPGKVGYAIAGSVGIGSALSLFFVFHTVMATAEAVIFSVGAMSAVLGIKSIAKHRRKWSTRYRKGPVILSPRARRHYYAAVGLKKYRKTRTSIRRKHPIVSGGYDRWLAKYEVTTVTGSGKTRKAESRTVRGIKGRNAVLSAEQSKAGTDTKIGHRQMFR